LDLFQGEEFVGRAAGGAVLPDVGDGAEPELDGGVDRVEGSEFEAGEKVPFDIVYCFLNAPLFVGLKRIAGPQFAAVVTGEVEVARVENGGLATLVPGDGDLTVVDD